MSPYRLIALLCVLLMPAVAVASESGGMRDYLRNRMAAGQDGDSSSRSGLMSRFGQRRQQDDGESQQNSRLTVQGLVTLGDQAYGPADRQKFDVYYTPGLKAAPVIFMVHGGAWMIGDKANRGVVTNKINFWAPQGYIIISTNYRMLPDASPYEQALDVARALAEAQRRAPEWGGDPDNFIVMGHSAGAHIVSLLSSNPTLATSMGAHRWRATISLDSAAMNVPSIMNAQHMRFYDKAFGSNPADWEQASPFHQLGRNAVPMLLICSSRRDDSCAQARMFGAKAARLGLEVSIKPQDLNHGQINGKAGLPGPYTELLDSFIKSHLN